MNKGELIKELAVKNEITQLEAGKILDSFIEIVTSLKDEEDLRIKGFGTFKVKVRKERKGTNPRTKKEMIIPESKTIGFNASKTLKEINQ